MKILAFTSFLILIFSVETWGQCAGLAIGGFNSDNPDQIFLIPTADLPGSTGYYITDNEWNGTSFNSGENITIWTTPSGGILAGTGVLLEGSTASLGTLSSAVPALATDGEEIYITSVNPSGTVSATNICFAVLFGGTGTISGISSVDIGDFDNAKYTGGDITNTANWTKSNSIISPLPVTLKYFSVITDNRSTLLSFSTATELNNSHFAIERSAEGRDFSEIGQVRGAGTTRVPQSYTFTDERPLQGLNYYRLRQVDFDGAESFSPVVSVVFGKRTGITLAPSPATDRVRIQLDEAFGNDGLWQVYDNTGRQVLSGAWEAESADYELDVNTLPEGMYTFRLVVGAQVEVKQFRKM